MDLTHEQSDNVVGAIVAGASIAVEVAQKAANAYKKIGNLPLLTRIRHKAQLKSGLKKLEKGDISGMSGGEKDRLVEAGIDPNLIGKGLANELSGNPTGKNTANTPLQNLGTNVNAVGGFLTSIFGSGQEVVDSQGNTAYIEKSTFQKLVPYIISAVILGLVIYFIIKHKK